MKMDFKVFAAALLAGAVLSHSAVAEVKLSAATTGQESSYYTYWAALAQVVNNTLPDIKLNVMETGGSVEDMKLMMRGDADIGQFLEPAFYEDYAAAGLAAGKEPKKNLRYLWPIIQVAFFNVVNAEKGVKSMGDLNGKAFSAGARGSLSEMITVTLLKQANIKAEMIRGGYGDLVAAMKDRRIVGFTKSGSLESQDASIMDVRTSFPIKIVGFTDQEIGDIKKAYPHYDFIRLAKTPYGDDPVALYTTAMIAGGTDKLDTEVIYKIYKTIAENMDKITKTFAPVKGIDLVNLTLETAKTPLHPGVVKYIQEKGKEVPAAILPPNK